MNFRLPQKGFSLVEMILYVTILTVVLILVINTILLFASTYNDLKALRIVEHSATDVMERITRDVRASTSVDTTQSVFGTSPGVLQLVATSGSVSTTTKYYLQNGVIKVDVNGTYLGPLTLTNASTTSLIFRRIHGTNSDAVRIDLTIQGTSRSVTKTSSYHSTVILRGM